MSPGVPGEGFSRGLAGQRGGRKIAADVFVLSVPDPCRARMGLAPVEVVRRVGHELLPQDL